MALSGIASRLGVSCQLGEYLAGVWRSSLPKSLLWHASEGSTRPLEYRARSWSWASFNGEVEAVFLFSRDGVLRPALQILDTSVTYTGASMGSVSSASIQVACQMCQVVFDKSIGGAQYKDGMLYLNPTRGYQSGQSLLQLLLDPDQDFERPDKSAEKEDIFLLSVYDMASNPASLFQIKEHEAAYLLVNQHRIRQGPVPPDWRSPSDTSPIHILAALLESTHVRRGPKKSCVLSTPNALL